MRTWIGLIFISICLVLPVALFCRFYQALKVQSIIPSGSQMIWQHPEELILYSLNPDSLLDDTKLPKFYSWEIYGQVKIENQAQRELVREIIHQGILDNGESYSCFSPRHAIRMVKDGHTLDILPCFACGQIRSYSDGKLIDGASFASKRQDELDQILKQAQIPIAPRELTGQFLRYLRHMFALETRQG